MIYSPNYSQKKPWKKYLIWGICTLMLILGIAWLATSFAPKNDEQNQLTATASIGDISQSVLAVGKFQAVTSVDVGTQVSGEITQLFVKIGDTVKKGAPIAQVDKITQENQLANAQIALTQAQAALAAAKATFNSRFDDIANHEATLTAQKTVTEKTAASASRLTELLAIDAISQQEYDNAQTQLATAVAALNTEATALANAKNSFAIATADLQSQRASVQKAENDLAVAKQALTQTAITAPIAGTVVQVITEQGATINASQSTPTIATIADLSRMRIHAQISEADIIHVKQGMPATFSIVGNPEQHFSATLSGIDPAAINDNHSGAVYYTAYLDVDNKEGKFLPGMTAQVNIITNERKNVLNIPASALIHQPNQTLVKVIKADGESLEIPVIVGLNNRIRAEIKSGISAGDVVVIGTSDDQSKDTNDTAEQ